MHKAKVKIIVLGGTITMIRKGEGIVPGLTGEDLVRAVPQLLDVADISVATPFSVPGASLTFAQLNDVARMIRAAFEEGMSGVVIVQGTDTIEETAFALDLLIQSERPVVVTGAMRGAEAPGADGPANLFAAVLTAASDEPSGLGTMVVLNDTIHSARLVQKSHTALPSAFTSPSAGPLGIVAENAARIFLRPQRSALDLLGWGDAPCRVAHIGIGLGDDGEIFDSLPEHGFQGLVVEAMGAGHVPAPMVPKLAKLAKRIPVVLSSRVSAGPIFMNTYSFPGSEIDLLASGLIPGGVLSACKARILLSLLISNSYSIETIRMEFGR